VHFASEGKILKSLADFRVGIALPAVCALLGIVPALQSALCFEVSEEVVQLGVSFVTSFSLSSAITFVKKEVGAGSIEEIAAMLNCHEIDCVYVYVNVSNVWSTFDESVYRIVEKVSCCRALLVFSRPLAKAVEELGFSIFCKKAVQMEGSRDEETLYLLIRDTGPYDGDGSSSGRV